MKDDKTDVPAMSYKTSNTEMFQNTALNLNLD